MTQLEQFAKYHVNQHGWPGLAYPYVIDPYGTVFKCQPISLLTWHAKGANTSSIGVMLMGNFEKTEPTREQLLSLRKLISEIRDVMPQVTRIIGHRDVKGSVTACPGKNFTPQMIADLNR